MTLSSDASIDGALWFTNADGNRLGRERLRLLEAVAETGSISQAARQVGLSYKAAWDALNAINNLADKPLFTRRAGGKHGGGTVVTDEGRQLIAMFRDADREWERLRSLLDRRMRDAVAFQQLMQRYSMRTSARNQLQGKVLEVRRGVVDAQVTLALSAQDRLVAVITNDSVDSLGLVEGSDAYALIKSTFVILARADDGFNTSARNRLAGVVSVIRDGPVSCEVVIDLNGGKSITAVVTRESVEALELKVGARAAALIKAPHVIIGVA